MNEQVIEHMVDETVTELREEGTEVTEEQMEAARMWIQKLSGQFVKKKADIERKKKQKAKNRTASKAAKKARKVSKK